MEGVKRRWFQFLGGWSSPTKSNQCEWPGSNPLEEDLVWGGRESQRGLHNSGASAPTARTWGLSTCYCCLNYAPSFLGSTVLVSQPTNVMVLYSIYPSDCLPEGVWEIPNPAIRHFHIHPVITSCLVISLRGRGDWARIS